MSTSREQPSTYFVQDRSNKDELSRLTIQDSMLTNGMGGVLPEYSEPERLQSVLDVACGPGNWLIETAKAYPMISRLVGVDISARMISYARSQVDASQVADRVSFQVMDALRQLEFPDATFDLVNQRMGQGYIRTWEWSGFLDEMMRVARPGGTIRLTESDVVVESNSPTYQRIGRLLLHAFYQAGHFFTEDTDGLTSHLASLLSRRGIQHVQQQVHTLFYRADSAEGRRFIEDTRSFLRVSTRFLQRWMRLPDDYDELCQQAIEELNAPNFEASWRLLTVLGQMPTTRPS